MGFIQGSQNFKSLNFKVFCPLNVFWDFFFYYSFKLTTQKTNCPALYLHQNTIMILYYDIMISLTHEMS